MIDTSTENLIPISKARDEFPQRPSLPTIWRWTLKGVRGSVLESVRVGGRRFTSREACRRFVEETSSDRPCRPKHPKRRKQQSIAHAQAILDQFGV
ncbi:MAG: DUF1580 domain-containing protein [Planctomycetales bacterium]|nr:DUF1580 domain-containing protein [Planctomycetales bacterium]